MAKNIKERRKYLRIEVPLGLRIISKDKIIQETTAKNISPVGLRFETKDKDIQINDEIELRMEIPNVLSPVHADAKVVWKKKLSSEDSAPQDIGCEFTRIEEDNKNTFLKYFCDVLYEQAREVSGKGEA